MAEAVVLPGREIAGSERAVSSRQVADATVAAERIVVGALETCIQRMGLESSEAAARRIEQGDGLACMHCCCAMARQVAELLGSVHQSIQAVYAPDCDACPQGFCFGEEGQIPPSVHLLVWARRKTAALDSQVAALRGSLARIYQDKIGTRGLSSLLNGRPGLPGPT